MVKRSRYQPAQDPMIKSQGLQEGISQLVVVGSAAGLSYWLWGFEVSLLVILVIGFSLTAMNITAAAVSTNVQIAEVRDLLKDLDRKR